MSSRAIDASPAYDPEGRICVVIPTLNRPLLLRRCLLSVLQGERLPEQVIVCDQSTGQDTREVVVDLIPQWPILVYMHLPRPHASEARNAGLDAAETELVAFIDDDCVAHPLWLWSLAQGYAEVSKEQPVSAVAGRVLPLPIPAGPRKAGHAVSSRVSKIKRYYKRTDDAESHRGWAPWDIGTGANLLAPRHALSRVGGFDTQLGPGSTHRAAEDIDLLYRLAAIGTAVYEPAAIVYHPTRDRWGRLSSRLVYGGGMGAMLGRHIVSGDSAARGLLLLYVRHQFANMTRRGGWGPLEAALTLAGTLRALARVWLETRMER
ncbi:MAG: glycosyltransferase [Chloroflexia bacterium]